MSVKSLEAIRRRCGDLEMTTDPAVLESHGRDWTRFRQPNPSAVAFPRSIAEVSELIRVAGEVGIALVPSGGRTGLSGGAVAAAGEVVVALDRMRRIGPFDAVDRLLTVEAGVTTGEVQARAMELGLFYPVSFAAEGSAQIGGNIATNAGGIRVLRYGTTRDRVAGLKVVDGLGRLLDLNRGLVKNASGYDLRQLMIGSEGTLGIVVEATLKLVDSPPPSRVMLLGLDSMPPILDVLRALRERLVLSACEFFSASALDLVCSARGLRRPLDVDFPSSLLVEFDLPPAQADAIDEAALQVYESATAAGWVRSGVISSSDAQAQALWSYRESISESAAPFTPYKNDLSVRLSQLPEFLERLSGLVQERFPGHTVLWYGHVGDGNLHLNILKPEGAGTADFEQRCKESSEDFYRLTQALGGSVSAEHGIGLLKRSFLHYSRSGEEIELMRGIKRVFDPLGILNPGKLL
jgi:FAD/FMN-containing dehydrogenase